MTLSNDGQIVFEAIQDCRACASIPSFPNCIKDPVCVLILLTERSAEDWGIYWYDHFRNLNARVMIVGMDFGDKPAIDKYRRTGVTPDKGGDNTFDRLRQFIRSAQIGDDVYLTNAALCVRDSDKASGDLNPQVYENCLVHLRAQLNLVRPEVIVTLGEKALNQTLKANDNGQTIGSLWPDQTITQFAGHARKVTVDTRELVLFPVLHPAYPQRWPLENPWNYCRQEEEFANVRRYLPSKS